MSERAVREWTRGDYTNAHGLYRKFGFAEPTPGRFLDRVNLDCDRE